MRTKDYEREARSYLRTFCSVRPNRRTGSSGNRCAADFFTHTILSHGYEVDTTPFACLDHTHEGAFLTCGVEAFEVFPSPYTLGCDVRAELACASTVEELENIVCDGMILLLHGPICAEQLMPKNFVFYNPEPHQKIIRLLEERNPAAIVAATHSNPEQVGALNPFPFIVDGDFHVPSVYCRKAVGESLGKLRGNAFHLRIKAKRIPSWATNVIARLNPGKARKFVLTAHIDAYESTPGALDNASGTVVLLLAAEMLHGYHGDVVVEVAALNGEDHYSAGGQWDYINRYQEGFSSIAVAVNIDDVGYVKGRSSYSFYGCTKALEQRTRDVFRRHDSLVEGEPWFSGDHMIFVQRGVPSIALTAEHMPELMRTVTHTSLDTPDLVDERKLVEVAGALNELVRSL